MTKLYGNPDNFRVKKVLIAAKLANKNVKAIAESPPAKIFPLGLVRPLIIANIIDICIVHGTT
jgi:hypothetical protein